MKSGTHRTLIFLLATLLLMVLPAAAGSGFDWEDKVDPWVMTTSRAGDTEFIVFLSEQADLSPARGFETKLDKGTFVYQSLSALAARSQQPVLDHLKTLGVEHRSYWVANMIWVRGSFDTIKAMAEREDIFHIYANPKVKMDSAFTADEEPQDYSPDAVEWNIALVNADDVWALGNDGSGAVAAGQDTGYMWNHPALINQYRGGAGNHDYNWHDAVHSGGGSCGADSVEPCDDHGHGTHTMGTIVGDDGVGNQVGMAPGAQWIGCRNMDVGVGTPTTYAECYQFFIAPTDLNDLNANPAMAPDVINNSWGCPTSEGCTDPNVLLTVVENVRAAGIVTVHSAGNSGSSCSTVDTPSAIYDESYTVGATNSSDGIASFSSRGPVTIDGSNRMKPDITAPGVNIRSSTRDGSYQGGWDGTSMAGPHVAGLVALLIGQNPGIKGNVNMIEDSISQTAVPLTTTQGCGGDSSTDVPNNVFGWGRIDALAAVKYIADFLVNASPSSQDVCVPGSRNFTIDVLQFQGFDEDVTLTTTGLPLGVSGGFLGNPVTPPGTSVLILTASAGAGFGGSAVTITGTSLPSSIVHETAVFLDLYTAPPSAPSLAMPADLETGVAVQPEFSWGAGPQARSFTIEIATDPGFTTIVHSSSGIVETTYSLTSVLDPSTTFYWRVTASNLCGTTTSSEFMFTTSASICVLPGLSIPDDNPTGVSDQIVVGDAGAITDLEVSIEITHTWVGDLVVTLTHDSSATSVVLIDQPGVPDSSYGCSSNNISAKLDDEAVDPVEDACATDPAIAGTFIPNNPLSAFDGLEMSGSWTLTVSDNVGGDTGTLDAWCLMPSVDSRPPEIFGDGFESGDSSQWSATTPKFALFR